jgi:membrane-associated two-gene conflict system component 1 (EACC1)
MGAVSDVIAVALGTGGAGTVLARALVAWISHRTTDVKLVLTRPEGTELSIDAHRVDDPQALIASIADFLDAPAAGRNSDETA